MLSSILQKEFLKLRVFWVMAIIFNVSIVGYLFMVMKKLFRIDHAEVVWYYAIHLGEVFYQPLMYVPLVTGMFFAAAQFFPEMRSHRFRISLHLPLQPHSIVFGHLFVGMMAIVAIFAMDVILVCTMVGTVFPAEYVSQTFFTIMPWVLGGVMAYLGTTFVLLEPVWKMRLFNFMVSAGLTGIFYAQDNLAAYSKVLPHLVLIVILFVPAVLIPAYRFRYRRV